MFAGSPVKRTGHSRFIRNVLIAAGNSGDATLVPAVRQLLGDAAPLVRAMAVWALAQLLPAAAFAELRSAWLPGETDSGVRGEWEGS
jgi:epoxyqueuosine reductase